jgi:hypothetical protein
MVLRSARRYLFSTVCQRGKGKSHLTALVALTLRSFKLRLQISRDDCATATRIGRGHLLPNHKKFFVHQIPEFPDV